MSESDDTRAIFNVPYARNPHFTGRDTYFESVSKGFASTDPTQRVQVIHGLGGIGKTQIALEYAYRHRDDYKIVWWLTADDSATLAIGYANLARRLGMRINDAANLEEIRHHLRRLLDLRSDWLLIFDTADEPQRIANYLPIERKGHILITSRNPNWSGVAKSNPLHKFERWESTNFLAKRAGKDAASRGRALDAGRLAQALGDLPLALDQAASVMEQSKISFGGYLHKFETHWSELLSQGRRSGHYPDSVAMTWELCFRQVQEDAPAAADLLNLLIFFATDEIDRSFVSGGMEYLNEPLREVVHDPTRFEHAVRALCRYSLVEATDECVAIHKLVAALARDRLSEAERKEWTTRAVKVAKAGFAFDSYDPTTWQKCEGVLPHVLTTAQHAEVEDVAMPVMADLLNDVGRYLHRRCQYQEAREVLERAWRVNVKEYGGSHPRVAGIANNLGRVMRQLGDLALAKDCFEKALAIDEENYGLADAHIATIVNNMAISTHLSGDLRGALEQFQWAMDVFRLHYGEDHPRIASVKNNIGYAQKAAGDLENARVNFTEALAIVQKLPQPTCPMAASVHHNLGLTLQGLGRMDEAREHLERALTVAEAIYGTSHIALGRDIDSLAAFHFAAGEYEKAQTLCERSLAIAQTAHVQSQTDVAARLRNLARVAKALGDIDRSTALQEQAAAITDTAAGVDLSATLTQSPSKLL